MAHGEFSTSYTSVFEYFKQHFEFFLVTITFKAKWPRALDCGADGTVAWTGEWGPPGALPCWTAHVAEQGQHHPEGRCGRPGLRCR